LLGGEYIEVLKPIRGNRFKLAKAPELGRALDLAALKLRGEGASTPSMVLVLLDAESDLPCILGPTLSSYAEKARPDVDVSCVIANIQYETWFIAAAESLTEFVDLSGGSEIPANPEAARQGKGLSRNK
jgi:hypothetical protein